MNARNAPWILAFAVVASLSAGCIVGMIAAPRRTCEVPCSSTLSVQATGPATYTLRCGGDR